jgi:hypothetical protein
MSKVIFAILILFVFSGCTQTAVINEKKGMITVKGPRVAWGPGHDTQTEAAQKSADDYCRSKGRGAAVFEAGQVKLFDGDYNQYSCSVPHEVVMKNNDVLALLDDIGSCVRGNIPRLDDLTSDAESIATAIGTVCSRTINKFVDVYLSEREATDGFNKTFREMFVTSQNKKILPFVLTWRRLLQEGWKKEQEPTAKQMPNKLYGV